MDAHTGRHPGRPQLADPTCVLSIRIPRSIYEAFRKRAEMLGFDTPSEPVRRWIRRQAGADPAPDSK